MPGAHSADLTEISQCWNSIYQTLSKTRKRYEELKGENPNITILVDEIGPKLKERFLEVVELILLECRSLNKGRGPKERRPSAVEWQYGPCTEYFLKNNILGTIVKFSGASDMPRDLIDEIAYLIASFAHDLPSNFLCNESILIPITEFFQILSHKPSKYSVVLCEKLVNRIVEYPPLWDLFMAEYEGSFGRLLLFLLSIPEAFPHISGLISKLLVLKSIDVESTIIEECLARISDRMKNDYQEIFKFDWEKNYSSVFVETLCHIDNLVQCLSDDGKCFAAEHLKESFVANTLKPSLRELKLFDGTVVKSLDLLASIFKNVSSIEICLPIGQCFKNYYFTELDENTDCLNLPRLFFHEGEDKLTMSIINMLSNLVENKSRQLLTIFQGAHVLPTNLRTLKHDEHVEMCQKLSGLLDRLPEAIHNKNIENTSQLYRSHLIHAEKEVPQTMEALNMVDRETSMFSSLVIKTFDGFKRGFWARSPAENLKMLRFIMSLVTKTDAGFCYEKLLGSDEVFSILEICENMVMMLCLPPIGDYVQGRDTIQSLARFRANLFENVLNGSAEQTDMFSPSGILEQLVSEMEAKTVGGLSGNILLFSCTLMRLIAIIQVQSTRPFKTTIYS